MRGDLKVEPVAAVVRDVGYHARTADRRWGNQPADATRAHSAHTRFASSRTSGWVLLTLFEAAALVAASVAGGLCYHEIFLGVLGPIRAFTAVGVLAGALYFGAMRLLESDRRLRRPNGWDALRDVTMVWVGIAFLITFVAFALKASELLSRGAMLSFFVLGEFAIVGIRINAPRIMALARRPTALMADDVLVVGAKGSAGLERLASELRETGYQRPTIVTIDTGALNEKWEVALSQFRNRLFNIARSCGPGDICVAAESLSSEQISDIVHALQLLPRAVRVVPEPAVEHMLHLPVRSVGGLYAVEFQKTPLNRAQTILKRLMDIAVVVPVLILISPVFLIISAVIKSDSLGPVFFRQRRLGYRGEPFSIFKFRTMSILEDGPVIQQAQKNDQRVTQVGRLLRKWSLDELPQLFNVLGGEMSLVGPRPHAVAHDELYTGLIDNYEIRQHVKPGMTGWAQVNGYRGETASNDAMRARIEHDIWYAKNIGLWLDVKILFQTIVVVLRGDNAY